MTRNDLSPTNRDQAVAESLRIVERNRGIVPEDRSLCLPATDTNPQSLRWFGYMVLFRLIGGILGIAVGGLIAFYQESLNDSGWLLLPALCCSIGGILLLLSNPFYQRWFVRRQTKLRYQELVSSGSYTSLVCVCIEDADTFHRFKLCPEDLGYLALDPSRSLAVIEGVCCRYIILGKDVRVIEQVQGGPTTATAIEYAIGEVTLRIALQYDSIWHELKRQTISAQHDPLLTRLRETLGENEVFPPE